MELDPDLIHKLWTHTNTQNPDFFINILNPDILKMVLRPHHIFNMSIYLLFPVFPVHCLVFYFLHQHYVIKFVSDLW
jgi:hypothetical protein